MFCNQNNKAFYDLSPENYINSVLVKNAGLDRNIDLEAISKYIHFQDRPSLVDLGAGEGRVLDFFKKKNIIELAGVEYSYSKFSYLKSKYFDGSVSIFHENILNFNRKYDYVLLSFSFLIEFNQDEQKALFSQLNKITQRKTFIDIPVFRAKTNGTYIENQMAQVREKWGATTGYFMTHKEIEKMVSNTDFIIEDKHSYETETKRKRQIYVLAKKEG